MFFKKRVLTVTTQPKIFYTDTDNVYKGEIPVSGAVKAELRSGKEFTVTVPGRVYYFKEIVDNPAKWVECINRVIHERFG